MDRIISFGIIDSMEGNWTYCCRCDMEGRMVPQGPSQWQCIKCGLRITATRVNNEDLFQADTDLTAEEVGRHVAYCRRLAEIKVAAMKKIPPPKIPFRMRIVIFVARVLRVKFATMYKEKTGGKRGSHKT